MATTTQTPITGPLSQEARDITGRALQGTLVDLVDLHLVAKQEHWNVIGRFFRSVHLQLDELVTSARGFADDVAERAATIGVPPDARASTVSQDTHIADPGAGWRSSQEVIEQVVAALGKVIARIRARIDETDKTDLVSQDLLISIAQSLEKTHWMWEAQLADAEG